MGRITRAFDLFYKRLGPTGSVATNPTTSYVGYLPEFWYTSSVSSSGIVPSIRVSGAFLNYPNDTNSDWQYVSTRVSASNNSYVALPWGSHAADFLWNVKTPSWSYQDVGGSYSVYTWTQRTWTVAYNSESFYRKSGPAEVSSFGVATYPITSSWTILDSKLAAVGLFSYIHVWGGSSAYPTFVGSDGQQLAYKLAAQDVAGHSENSLNIGYPITYPDTTSSLGVFSTSSVDRQYFDIAGGAGITQTAISASLVEASTYATTDTLFAQNELTKALKARRLYFPVPVSGSGTVGGTDYWFKTFTGYRANELFDENGGIYNIQFSLKSYISSSAIAYKPDTGSFMTVFIHDVHSSVPFSANRKPGAAGWYPPPNNIVTIGNKYNGAPEFSFFDLQTGYLVEKFNINVIQYGYPAQLCIEASGSLADNAYFGIVVDELQICKIGVTTDPRFIKPVSITQQVASAATRFANISGEQDIQLPPNPSE